MKTLIILVWLVLTVAIADLISTWLALARDYTYETNSISAWLLEKGSWGFLVPFSLLLVSVWIAVAIFLYRKYKSRLATGILLCPYIFTGTWAVVNNLRLVL